jgi:uncharacterized protein YndB with AHSA1/START domain
MTAEHTIVLSAPPERVFDALTRPEHITRWWGEESVYWMTNVQHDMHPGGIANYGGTFSTNDTVSGSTAGREFLGTGTTRAVDAPRMLEYTRRYTDGIPCKEETVIRYDLEPHNGGTRLKVTHTGFETEEMAAMHTHGWERAFGWLEAYLSRSTS